MIPMFLAGLITLATAMSEPPAAPVPAPAAAVAPAPDPVAGPASPLKERTVRVPFAGQATLYEPETAPTRAVVFISGDGGWNKGVVDMARRAVRVTGALVAGVSYPAMRKAALSEKVPCWCPACDLEEISKAVEKQAGFAEYAPPILVGYSSGATLVYAALAGAPPETFAGGVSLGFCPDMEQVPSLCRHAGWRPAYDVKKRRADLPQVEDLARPWVALQGKVDKVCDPAKTAAFVTGVKGARVAMLDGVGHGYGNERRWGTAFDDGLRETSAPPRETETSPAPAAAPEGAPVGEPPAARAAGSDPAADPRPPSPDADTFAKLGLPLELKLLARPRAWFLFVSGDGGWSKLDQVLVAHLADSGVATVAMNTLKYFWKRKEPATAAADLRRLYDLVKADGAPIFAGGYSFGAEVVPFMVARPEMGNGPLAGMILVAPGPFATWEVSPLDWLRTKEKESPDKVLTQIQALGALPVACLYGEDDKESICRPLGGHAGMSVVPLGGGHHFGGDYDAIAEGVVAFVEKTLREGAASAR
jgi:type IV secretory pathway VirJ component